MSGYFEEERVTRKLVQRPEQAKLAEKLAKLTPAARAKILESINPRIVEEYMAHIPHPRQQVFLSLKTREALFGGAGGGGKSDALLMGALQYADVPGYSAMLLRRTWIDLNATGALLDRATTWFSGTRAKKRDGGRIWEFPTTDRDGRPAQPARITFGYLQHEADKYKLQSAEYQFLGFDELTQFEESVYTYSFSRLRRPRLACLNCYEPVKPLKGTFVHTRPAKSCKQAVPDPKVLAQYPPAPDGMTIFDVPLRVRAGTNPGGKGHEWVKDRFINPKTRDKRALFLPSSIADNPAIDYEEYVESLSYLLPAERDRMLHGDWDVAESGDMFARHDFKMLPGKIEPQGQTVRFWDNASSEGKGDWTVGAKMVRTADNKFVLLDIVRGQWSTLQKKKIMQQTAALDGTRVSIRMEQEPGSSGVDVIDDMRRNVFAGYDFKGERSTGDKVTRATPFATMVEGGNVYLMGGAWNRPYIDEVTQFPNGSHDDQVDSSSAAYNFLGLGNRVRLLV